MTPEDHALADLDSRARHVQTPAGEGTMIWRVWGSGKPVVLLHGGHGSWRHWARNILPLAERAMLVLPDIPGFGESAPIMADTLDPLGEAIAHGLDAIGVTGDYLLGGFSFGGLVAGHVLPLHAPRIKRMLLVGSGGLGPYSPVTGQLRRWQETPQGPERRAIHRHNLSVLMMYDQSRIDELAITIQAANAQSTVNTMRNAFRLDGLRAALERFPLPVTAMWGQHDVLARNHLEGRRAFLEALYPGNDVTILPGVGHWAQYEAPEAVNALLARGIAATQL